MQRGGFAAQATPLTNVSATDGRCVRTSSYVGSTGSAESASTM
jgi:hypothetical protein